MKLPLSYSMRNILRRPWRTGMTILGLAVVIFAIVLMLGLSRGMMVRLDVSGEPENLLLISRKGQNIMFSAIEEEDVVHLYSLPDIATGASGDLLVSPELMHVSFVGADANGKSARTPVSVRGVQKVAFQVHQKLQVTEGKRPTEPFDILAGETAHIKLGLPKEALAVGKTVTFEKKDWKVAGRFKAEGSVVESELWVDEADLHTVLRRRTHSFAVVRFKDATSALNATSLFSQTGAIERLFKGWRETAYYDEVSASLQWVYYLSVFMVGAIAIAGSMIGVNTMYTAIIGRMREMATQRVLGFSQVDIVIGLLIESTLIALIGGLIGATAGFIANGLPMKMSQGAFTLTVDGTVFAASLLLALFIGTLGALLPAGKALRMTIVEALRYE